MTEIEDLKAESPLERNLALNMASQIPFNIQVISPLIDCYLNGRSTLAESFMSASNPEEVSTRAIAGLGIVLLGSVAKNLSDMTSDGMETICSNLGRTNEEKKLVNSGFYRLCRHPCYSLQRIVSTGAALAVPNPINAVAYAIQLGLTELLARREEKACEEVFGEEYRKYKREVPRWINLKSLKNIYQSLRKKINPNYLG